MEVLVAILVFVAVVTGLSLLVVGARALLLPRRDVVVTVNERRTVRGRAGEKLLAILSDGGVPIPAACGGTGVCGLCRVSLGPAATAPLPAERARIARRDLAAGVRLACLTAVRGDLAVRVPDEVLGARSFVTRVVSSRTASPLIRELVLAMPEGERLAFRAGAFVQVRRPPGVVAYRDLDVAPEHRAVWDAQRLWRHVSTAKAPVERAYSIASPPAEGERLVLLIRLALPPWDASEAVPPGLVSSWLFGRQVGDEVELSGPFGDFAVPEGEGADEAGELVLIGGGVGMAPLRSILLDLLGRRRASRPITYWYGARSRRELLCADELDALARAHPNFRWKPVLSEPAPDDAWTGPTGFVHQAAGAELARHPAPEAASYYLCGPPLMIEAVRTMLDGLGVEPDRIHFDDFGSAS